MHGITWLDELHKFGESDILNNRRRLVTECDTLHDFQIEGFLPGAVLVIYTVYIYIFFSVDS